VRKVTQNLRGRQREETWSADRSGYRKSVQRIEGEAEKKKQRGGGKRNPQREERSHHNIGLRKINSPLLGTKKGMLAGELIREMGRTSYGRKGGVTTGCV